MEALICVTYRCNAKCHMCNIWEHPTKPSEEICPSLMEKLPDGLRINITGGEPTLRKDINEFFELKKEENK